MLVIRILLFFRPEVPPQDSAFDALLQSNAIEGSMGPECIRSFNGYRSTIELLKLVPNTEVMILNFALIFRLRSPTLGALILDLKIFLRSKHMKTNLDVFEKLSLREKKIIYKTLRFGHNEQPQHLKATTIFGYFLFV